MQAQGVETHTYTCCANILYLTGLMLKSCELTVQSLSMYIYIAHALFPLQAEDNITNSRSTVVNVCTHVIKMFSNSAKHILYTESFCNSIITERNNSAHIASFESGHFLLKSSLCKK